MIFVGDDNAKVTMTCALLVRENLVGVKKAEKNSYRFTAEVVCSRQLTEDERNEVAKKIYNRVLNGE